jgi:hypothetical protein
MSWAPSVFVIVTILDLIVREGIGGTARIVEQHPANWILRSEGVSHVPLSFGCATRGYRLGSRFLLSRPHST